MGALADLAAASGGTSARTGGSTVRQVTAPRRARTVTAGGSLAALAARGGAGRKPEKDEKPKGLLGQALDLAKSAPSGLTGLVTQGARGARNVIGAPFAAALEAQQPGAGDAEGLEGWIARNVFGSQDLAKARGIAASSHGSPGKLWDAYKTISPLGAGLSESGARTVSDLADLPRAAMSTLGLPGGKPWAESEFAKASREGTIVGKIVEDAGNLAMLGAPAAKAVGGSAGRAAARAGEAATIVEDATRAAQAARQAGQLSRAAQAEQTAAEAARVAELAGRQAKTRGTAARVMSAGAKGVGEVGNAPITPFQLAGRAAQRGIGKLAETETVAASPRLSALAKLAKPQSDKTVPHFIEQVRAAKNRASVPVGEAARQLHDAGLRDPVEQQAAILIQQGIPQALAPALRAPELGDQGFARLAAAVSPSEVAGHQVTPEALRLASSILDGTAPAEVVARVRAGHDALRGLSERHTEQATAGFGRLEGPLRPEQLANRPLPSVVGEAMSGPAAVVERHRARTQQAAGRATDLRLAASEAQKAEASKLRLVAERSRAQAAAAKAQAEQVTPRTPKGATARLEDAAVKASAAARRAEKAIEKARQARAKGDAALARIGDKAAADAVAEAGVTRQQLEEGVKARRAELAQTGKSEAARLEADLNPEFGSKLPPRPTNKSAMSDERSAIEEGLRRAGFSDQAIGRMWGTAKAYDQNGRLLPGVRSGLDEWLQAYAEHHGIDLSSSQGNEAAIVHLVDYLRTVKELRNGAAMLPESAWDEVALRGSPREAAEALMEWEKEQRAGEAVPEAQGSALRNVSEMVDVQREGIPGLGNLARHLESPEERAMFRGELAADRAARVESRAARSGEKLSEARAATESRLVAAGRRAGRAEGDLALRAHLGETKARLAERRAERLESGKATVATAGESAPALARAQQAEALAVKEQERLSTVSRQAARRKQQVEGSLAAAPARLRPALAASRAAAATLEQMAKEASKSGAPVTAKTMRSLSQQLPTVLAALDQKGIADRIGYVPGGYSMPRDAAGRPRQLPPIVQRKLSSESTRQTTVAPLTAGGQLGKYADEFRTAAANDLAKRFVAERGFTAEQILGRVPAEHAKVVEQMGKAGYVPFNPFGGRTAISQAGKAMYVPKEVAAEIERHINPTSPSKWGRFLDRATQIRYTASLTFNPGFWAQQTSEAMMRAWSMLGINPVKLVTGTAEAAKFMHGKPLAGEVRPGWKTSPALEARRWLDQHPDEAAMVVSHGLMADVYRDFDEMGPTGLQQKAGPVGAVSRGAAKVNEVAGKPAARIRARQHHVEQSMRLGVWINLMADGMDPLAAAEQTIRAMGDYRSGPTGRQIRRYVPAWSWIRESAKWATRLPVEHPVRMMVALSLAQNVGGGTPEGESFGWIRSELEGVIGEAAPGNRRELDSYLNPAIRVPITAATGQKPFSGRVSRPPGRTGPLSLHETLNVAGSSIPQVRLGRALYGPQVRRYSTGQPMLSKSGRRVAGEPKLASLAQILGASDSFSSPANQAKSAPKKKPAKKSTAASKAAAYDRRLARALKQPIEPAR